MGKKVLIIYHSNYGYVTQIANFIKDRLLEKEVAVVTVDVIRSQNIEVYPLEQYSGIILGVSQGLWELKKLKKSFLEGDLSYYKKQQHPVGYFENVVNPGSLIRMDKNKQRLLKYLKKKLGFLPDLVEIFKPVLDFSPFSPVERGELVISKAFTRLVMRKKGIEIDYKGVNDFRDWDNISLFVDKFASLMK
jgi:menaquinone-dependent protoporphyrinogen IX oxidase